ncbi:MAG: hypothetical protein A3G51_02555 [Candidatus Yanofskybacteria bacterium RIFCSPLOWO2_12_FULL_43_11b]|uniref:Formyl transferase N-terminal domain-containing protein n=1 Tax=Candidatus Yanofskybacteria bacterium RIFCSPLOWO2_12_FULL_43_11b TaxID=1802710 RepID=A0A1F8H7G8_9BACT|nr:MAG: hypothetical protein A2923_02255 [Candidatus Yanofskybacteria bacterium RIFCSPLOWO2_01_FULL_43_46]OGN33542.1 MAG: hypothetical protein A3G51_02555 [Candidatus Yanofskybacteria bacterium RIFCSPLOWO2_12_FULL_43_11b]
MTSIKKHVKNKQLFNKGPDMSEREIKNVIFMGKKPLAVSAFEYLLQRGINVKLVVAMVDEPFENNLANAALSHGIPLYTDPKEIYELIDSGDEMFRDVDLVISYLFWKRMKNGLIKLPKWGCVNFHPAPLPDYKGRAGYNTAILDKRDDFGVSAHFIDSEEFDVGPIIKVTKFKIEHDKETAYSLEAKSQQKMLELFKEVINLFTSNEEIQISPNSGGLHLTGEQLEEMKKVDLAKDSAEEIDRKVRAFFFPPYTGAKLIVGEKEFTLVNQGILNLFHEKINKKLPNS